MAFPSLSIPGTGTELTATPLCRLRNDIIDNIYDTQIQGVATIPFVVFPIFLWEQSYELITDPFRDNVQDDFDAFYSLTCNLHR